MRGQTCAVFAGRAIKSGIAGSSDGSSATHDEKKSNENRQMGNTPFKIYSAAICAECASLAHALSRFEKSHF
jgi:hypothetical protein